MIGTRIESSPSLPLVFYLSGVGFLGLMVCGLMTQNVDFAIASIPLILAAVLSYANRERQISIDVESDGLGFSDSDNLIPYDTIRSLSPAPVRSEDVQFDIDIMHSGGTLTIPRSVNLPSHKLHLFLHSQLPAKRDGFVHPALDGYLKEQRDLFGQDKVFLFSPRTKRESPTLGRTARQIGLWLMLTATVWGLATTISTMWSVWAILAGIFGVIFFIASFATHDPVIRGIQNWQESTLIVSPTGIALVQGNLKGKLRWDEVRTVKHIIPGNFTIGRVIPGLAIQVSGSQIVIADIYDEGMLTIKQKVMAYYSGITESYSKKSST